MVTTEQLWQLWYRVDAWRRKEPTKRTTGALGVIEYLLLASDHLKDGHGKEAENSYQNALGEAKDLGVS